MVSIRQTTYPDLLPDFRNLGIIARVLVAVNALALVGALFAAPDLAQAIDRFPQIAALVEPLLLACLVALFERYAEIEQLRLGERLRVTWELDAAPSDALLPALVLQPLLENAVYHGVEPGTTAGEVLVRIERRGDRVLARIENPYVEEQQHRAGNRMALENIRERLALFFDAEARIETRISDGRYRVEIEIPYRVASR